MKSSPIILLSVAALVLAACSGGTRYSSANAVSRAAVPSVMFATGPIYAACRASDRKAADRVRCGCVQAVANRTLSDDEQQRGAGFFSDPHQAQVVRQSDRPRDEVFWTRWRAYGDEAAQLCT